MFLKWENDIIGKIDEQTHKVSLMNTDLNPALKVIFQDRTELSPIEWRSFLEDRIVSRDRRDIEKYLFRCGLSFYDPFRIAEITRGISAKDKLWIAFDADEKYEECVQKSFSDIVFRNLGPDGDSIHSPSGQNIKTYGRYGNKFGIYKKRLNPLSTDVESEVAVYLLASAMKIPCCPAVQTDRDTVFSEFLYDFNKEYLVHFRHLLVDYVRDENEVKNILDIRPEYEVPLFQMLVLDFVTMQDDRHLSNFAVKISGNEESFYPLYDNGRSLFYQDREDFVKECLADPALYSTSFGPVGTYWEHIQDMLKENPTLMDSVNISVSVEEIRNILIKSNFSGYRLEGAQSWIAKTLSMLDELFLRLRRERVHTKLDDMITDCTDISKQKNQDDIDLSSAEPNRER